MSGEWLLEREVGAMPSPMHEPGVGTGSINVMHQVGETVRGVPAFGDDARCKVLRVGHESTAGGAICRRPCRRRSASWWAPPSKG